ncbi:hypothetical protein NQT62_00005, partial [Limnobacter humi]
TLQSSNRFENRLLASFRAACRAAEKRDYAHLFLTCQTLFGKKVSKALHESPPKRKNSSVSRTWKSKIL